jgi:hypothetical protein
VNAVRISPWVGATIGALVVLVLLFTSLGADAAPGGANLSAYFPMTPGWIWVYNTNDMGRIAIRVGDKQRLGNQDCRIFETVVGQNVVQAECHSITSEGVYTHQRVSATQGGMVLTPPQRILAAPVAVGRAWQWQGKIGDQGVVFEYSWARRDLVKTGIGSFNAMQLFMTATPGPGVVLQSWRWFAPNIGMVKEDTVVTQGGSQQRHYVELFKLIK